MRRGRGNVTQPHTTEGKIKESRVTTAGRGAFRPGLSPGVVHGGGRQRFEGLLRRAQLDARLLLHGAPAQGRRWQELRRTHDNGSGNGAGGGGSYNSGSNPSGTANVNDGDGLVHITIV